MGDSLSRHVEPSGSKLTELSLYLSSIQYLFLQYSHPLTLPFRSSSAKMSGRDARDRAPRVKNRAPAAVQVSRARSFWNELSDTLGRSLPSNCFEKLRSVKNRHSRLQSSVFRISKSFQSSRAGRGMSLRGGSGTRGIAYEVSYYTGHLSSAGLRREAIADIAQPGSSTRNGSRVRTTSIGTVVLGVRAGCSPGHRSRSVFERALDVDPRSIDLWVGLICAHSVKLTHIQLKYSDMVCIWWAD